MRDLSNAELEQIALLGLGFAVGFALFVMVASLVEEWVIESDLADRERIREILREMLEASESKPAQAEASTGKVLTAGAAT